MGAIVGGLIFLYLQYSFCPGDNCTDDAPDSQINAGLQVHKLEYEFILNIDQLINVKFLQQVVFSVCGALSIMG